MCTELETTHICILTPSHLLTGRRVLSIPDEFAAEEDETDVQLLTRRRYFSKLIGQYLEPLET